MTRWAFSCFFCVLSLAACSTTTKVKNEPNSTSGGSGGSGTSSDTGGSSGVGGGAGESSDATGGAGGSANSGGTSGTDSGGTGGGAASGGDGGTSSGGTSSGGTTGIGGGAGEAPDSGGTGGTSSTGGASGTGGSPGTGGTTSEPAFKRVFVTSGRYSGDLHTEGDGTSGIAGGDNLCNMLAENAGLDGSFRAWLSVGVGAFDRIPTTDAAWHLLDSENTVVFPTRDSLQTTPLAAIDVDENGQQLTSSPNVWTGTEVSGQPSGTNSLGRCASWNAGAATAGTYGDMKSTGNQWTDAGLENCNNNLNRLYCFEL